MTGNWPNGHMASGWGLRVGVRAMAHPANFDPRLPQNLKKLFLARI